MFHLNKFGASRKITYVPERPSSPIFCRYRSSARREVEKISTDSIIQLKATGGTLHNGVSSSALGNLTCRKAVPRTVHIPEADPADRR